MFKKNFQIKVSGKFLLSLWIYIYLLYQLEAACLGLRFNYRLRPQLIINDQELPTFIIYHCFQHMSNI